MATHLSVIVGDITTLLVDAIVNAAPPGLGGGTGVSRAIHLAAGPALFEAASALDPLSRGDAALTPGFALPARFVIHTVGPVWIGGQIGEAETLARCYRRSLEVALAEGSIRTVAFPAISTGAYRFPKEDAARIAVATVQAMVTAHPAAFSEIIFCCHGEDQAALHRAELDRA